MQKVKLLVNEVCAPKTKTATVTICTNISIQQQHLKSQEILRKLENRK